MIGFQLFHMIIMYTNQDITKIEIFQQSDCLRYLS